MAKRIVLTGVGRGLGLALAEKFIELGHTVVGCSRSSERIQQLSDRFPAPHRFTAVDVTRDDEVRHWAERVLAEGDAPDLLINNAGVINHPATLWEVSAEEFSQVIDVNLKGVFHVIRHFTPPMIATGRGVIVNLSSGWGRSVSPEVAPYCATKWGVEGLTRALAKELPRPLAAVPLNPGVIHTDMLATAWGDAAAAFPDPSAWAERAAPFLLELGPKDNGQPLTAPS